MLAKEFASQHFIHFTSIYFLNPPNPPLRRKGGTGCTTPLSIRTTKVVDLSFLIYNY